MPKFSDLRDYLNYLDSKNLLRIIEGADWFLEIGAITELVAMSRRPKALLFDSIKGYPKGYRVATCLYASSELQAIALNLPHDASVLEQVRVLKERIKNLRGIPPKEVNDGPVKENVLVGDDVNVLKFPAPFWHEGDGGRYIGTGDVVITYDPEEEWVNLGVYRVQVYDEKTLLMMIIPGHHGRMIMQKYWSKGRPAPVAIALGQEPMVFAAAGAPLPWGMSEYHFAGGLKEEPINVIVDEDTELPVPATAEVVIFGLVPPPEEKTLDEGPFGECTGYYTHRGPGLVVHVTKIWYRNNPIIQGNPPLKGSVIRFSLGAHLFTSALTWIAIEKEVPEVKGVYALYQLCQTGPSVLVISIKQAYPGHAKQAALAALGSQASARFVKVVVVVDEDVDITNPEDVLWAICTRVDPYRDIDIIRGIPSMPLDPSIPKERKEFMDYTTSTLVIDATKKPFGMRDKFPRVNVISPELKKKIMHKWRHVIKDIVGE